MNYSNMSRSKQSSLKNSKAKKEISNKKHKKKSSDNIVSDSNESEDFDKYDNVEAITEYDQVDSEAGSDDESEEESGEESDGSVEESEEESVEESEEESEESDKKKSKKKNKEKNNKEDNKKSKSKNNDKEDNKKVNISQNKLILKKNIESWIKDDDKIKELNILSKEYKDSKKEKEKEILSLIKKLGMEEAKLDVTNKRGDVTARVYRHTSITKSAIKEDLLKDALMEIYQSETKSDQIIKKIDSKRKLNERFYLKRTKGEAAKK